MQGRDPRTRIADNPFHVLGLSAECSRADVEREGQKLLGMLELGLSAARTYDTPLGPQERTAGKVREAMAELRDPERRLAHELWARCREPGAAATAGAREHARAPRHDPAPWPHALAHLGWRRS